VDLSVDVPAEKFIEAIKKHRAEIVGMSALITPAIHSMRKSVDTIKETGLKDKVKIIIRGWTNVQRNLLERMHGPIMQVSLSVVQKAYGSGIDTKG